MTMLAAILMAAQAGPAASPPAPPVPAPIPAPIEVMVLGTYHLSNPGRDKVNVRADDVTAPRRQHELDVLADTLAAFHPTRVMVEREIDAATRDVPAYARFGPALLASDRGEDVQIGFRVAHRVGLRAVQGIDETGRVGNIDYFPMDRVETYAKAHGQSERLAAAFAPIQASAKAFEAAQATTSIPRALIRYNDPANANGGLESYYRVLPIGDGADQPGAELNAAWYLRNAKIFSKLAAIARPGDRVLVVYGAGHGYWLCHFAHETPGFASVDVRPYLTQAADRLDAGK